MKMWKYGDERRYKLRLTDKAHQCFVVQVCDAT